MRGSQARRTKDSTRAAPCGAPYRGVFVASRGHGTFRATSAPAISPADWGLVNRPEVPTSRLEELQSSATTLIGVTRPAATDIATSVRMSRQRRQDTRPELVLRRLLHAAGLRYRVGLRVPGLGGRSIDIAFTRVKIAVFVDGCFWHVCPDHATWPQTNRQWWRRKLEGNVARDRDTDTRLRREGWEVIRIWEHESPSTAAERVSEAVRRRAC